MKVHILSSLIIFLICFLVRGSPVHVLMRQEQMNEIDHSHPKFRKDLSITSPIVHKLDIHSKEPCDMCPSGGVCVPRVQCPSHVRDNADYPACHGSWQNGNGRMGVCCTTGQNHTSISDLKMRSDLGITEEAFQIAKSKSVIKLKNWLAKEFQIVNSNKHDTIVDSNTPSFGHVQSNRVEDPVQVTPLGHGALKNLFATQALRDRQMFTVEQIELGLTSQAGTGIFCPPLPICSSQLAKYMRIDGNCNNQLHTSWGAVNTPYERLLPPNYSDGVWMPRVSVVQGAPLTGGRTISDAIIIDVDLPSPKFNLMLMQFGQFATHDTTAAVTLTFSNGSAISCCKGDGTGPLPDDLLHIGCDPIIIKPTDRFFSRFKQRCMNFVRTQLAVPHDCSLGYARQMNGVTHFLDMSHIYGSSEEKLATMREFSGGRLKVFNDFGRDLLPLTAKKDDCISTQKGAACFASGDDHVNQMISLVAVHLLFTREHNRVAGILSQLNPDWPEDTLFFEARRVAIAEMQHILYYEWLPVVIGNEAIQEFNLLPAQNGVYSQDYDPNVNPSLTAEFAVAALRFGHSAVDGNIRIMTSKGKTRELIYIPEVMFHPTRFRLFKFYDRLLNGLTKQPMQAIDPSVTESLTRYMFHGGNPFGLDLAAINIKRGRDHGLRSYNDYRKLVGQQPLQDFSVFGEKAAERLQSVYASPDDIDLWVGGLLEPPVEGAIVGLTFRDILADQFSRWRRGDRYFYEHGPDVNPGAFTKEQLMEIKKVTMARIVCDNSDHREMKEQPINAFKLPNAHGNENIKCNSGSIPQMDLNPWREF